MINKIKKIIIKKSTKNYIVYKVLFIIYKCNQGGK